MASLSTDRAGNRTVQFVGTDGKRRSIRLGSISKRDAERVKLRIEHLHAAKILGSSPDPETADWLSKIGDDLHGKLAAVGLVAPRQSAKLGEFLREYLTRRRAESKPGTVVFLRTVANDLTRFYGPDCDLRSISEAKGSEFRQHYIERQKTKLSAATASRRLVAVKMFFDRARRAKLIPSNPFADLSLPGGGATADRKHYVSVADAVRLIDAANPTWRVIVALARYAGLRSPSETLSLKWADMNLPAGRMMVTSPKTEYRPGRGCRPVPIFAALRPYLEEAFDATGDTGAVYVVPDAERLREDAITPAGWVGKYMRAEFESLVWRAGLEPWPKPFNVLRSSCATDLVQEFPAHVAARWLGHTPTIAQTHYLTVTDTHFEKAIRGAESGAVVVQNPVQPVRNKERQEPTDESGHLETKPLRRTVAYTDAYCTEEQMIGRRPA